MLLARYHRSHPEEHMRSNFPLDNPLTQWQRLLKNVGTWQGSFTQLVPKGQDSEQGLQILNDVPTEVALIPQDDDSAMRQEIRRFPLGEPAQTQVLEYRSLNRSTLFFENGAFSQGSTQWGPFSEFGAELGFIDGNRRSRLVQLFKASEFKQITLIREQRQGSSAPEKPPLSVEDLLGTWQGEAVTQYADLRPEQSQATQLKIEKVGDQSICQTLIIPGLPTLTSTGLIEGQTISFKAGLQPVQVILLPDGASATLPSRIASRQPFFLEAGWLLNAHTRQRLIRRYDATGAWVSLTLVIEQKQ